MTGVADPRHLGTIPTQPLTGDANGSTTLYEENRDTCKNDAGKGRDRSGVHLAHSDSDPKNAPEPISMTLSWTHPATQAAPLSQTPVNNRENDTADGIKRTPINPAALVANPGASDKEVDMTDIGSFQKIPDPTSVAELHMSRVMHRGHLMNNEVKDHSPHNRRANSTPTMMH